MATAGRWNRKIPKKLRAGGTIDMWPSTRGGKNWPHARFNPNTGLLYANTIHGYQLTGY
jgi:alcohol dehydrogenase (cytochrome c)